MRRKYPQIDWPDREIHPGRGIGGDLLNEYRVLPNLCIETFQGVQSNNLSALFSYKSLLLQLNIFLYFGEKIRKNIAFTFVYESYNRSYEISNARCRHRMRSPAGASHADTSGNSCANGGDEKCDGLRLLPCRDAACEKHNLRRGESAPSVGCESISRQLYFHHHLQSFEKTGKR